jgi:hypothetical protein
MDHGSIVLPKYRPRFALGCTRTKSLSHNYTDFLHSFIHSSMALLPFVGPWPLIQFRNNFTQTEGLLGRVISSSQGHYLHRTTQTQNKSHTDIRALSGMHTVTIGL